MTDACKAVHSVSEIIAHANDLARALHDLQDKYNELIYAVERKHPDEDRHATALRYIRRAEQDMTPEQLAESLRQQLASYVKEDEIKANVNTLLVEQLAECQAKVQKYRGDIASYIAMEQGEDAAANYLAKEPE
jgi:hypothetical protein